MQLYYCAILGRQRTKRG